MYDDLPPCVVDGFGDRSDVAEDGILAALRWARHSLLIFDGCYRDLRRTGRDALILMLRKFGVAMERAALPDRLMMSCFR